MSGERIDINYDFVFYVYLASSVLCILLLVLEKLNTLDLLPGAWIVLAPFIPCAIFTFFKRSQRKSVTENTKKEN